jgi:hypothetical protein
VKRHLVPDWDRQKGTLSRRQPEKNKGCHFEDMKKYLQKEMIWTMKLQKKL